jgi:glutamate-ammonia-ligase adenylyltransferase
MMFEQAPDLLFDPNCEEGKIADLLSPAGFSDWQAARRIFLRLGGDEPRRAGLGAVLPDLLTRISGAAGPDRVLAYFDRLVSSEKDAQAFYHFLLENPRGIEIMVMLFSSSQYLSEILLRNPDYLPWLVEQKLIYHPKKLEALYQETLAVVQTLADPEEQLNALRHFQKREFLRIGLSDLLDQFDLSAATRQLSHLADSMVRVVLCIAARQTGMPVNEEGYPLGFAVIVMGKLGGRELNYSSDIDLLFVSQSDQAGYHDLGHKVIDGLTRITPEGFLYRVDMRLRPWGHVGALVPPISGYLNYLRTSARLWEKQAMLKARVLAGDDSVGSELLLQANALLFNLDPEIIRKEVYGMKQMTEEYLKTKGRDWGEVKLGEGSIRDIEFVVQYLQLAYGGRQPEIRIRNTLEALRRLLKYGLLPAGEFRLLTEGYTFLRTIEHHLQMMNYRQSYTLPGDQEALVDLARRLGFEDEPAGGQFLARYEQYSTAIRQVYLKYMENPEAEPPSEKKAPSPEVRYHIERMDPLYEAVFSRKDIRRHALLAGSLSRENLVVVEAVPLEDEYWRATIVAYDYPGELSLICGLMFVYGFNIHDGNVFTYESPSEKNGGDQRRKIVDVFTVKGRTRRVTHEMWNQYAADLASLLALMQAGQRQEARIMLAKRAAATLAGRSVESATLYPIKIDIDNESSEKYTILRIDALDTMGFLYELTNALAFNQVYIARMEIETTGNRINDVLYVTGAEERKILDPARQRELRAATVLIKHFTHLLPHSPDPESALLHFREFIGQLFRQANWPDQLASLEKPDVLQSLARLLGVSDFLWYDFLRMQHDNLFPVVSNVEALKSMKTRDQLQSELETALNDIGRDKPHPDTEAWHKAVNDFKDREMFRIDMRHILGHTAEIWDFSDELTALAEVLVNAVFRLTCMDMQKVYRQPLLDDGSPSSMTVCALGKCGGQELGFASDIELMFVYSGNGKTSGPKIISSAEYHEKVVTEFLAAVKAKQEGIFQIDLQLRPYGKAGSLAVSLEAFRRYFIPGGAAWPYERQALVRLRPIAGDEALGREVVALRDNFVYTGEPFDVTAMRGMRERQVRHLVKAGTFNPKHSPGGLVDVEYLIQGLQITHGLEHPELRATNTHEAMRAMARLGIITEGDYTRLRKAHTFLRWLVDSLRMVAGSAKGLSVPPADSEEYAFLARRLLYGDDLARLTADLELHTTFVQEVNRRLLGG